MKIDNLFEIKYDSKGTSVNVNEFGMREMQSRVYEKRNSKYLLVKSPPASGKSRALMFTALDKLHNQGIKKVIVAVPERSIGKSFRDTKLTEYGYMWDWKVKDCNNLTNGGTEKSKVKHFVTFMNSKEPSDNIIICTQATLRFAYEELDDGAFNNTLLAIDEFHHVSQAESSVLGNALRNIMKNSNAHIFAMTGSYFRGDSVPILEPSDEQMFNRVTYTYYEQLEGYKYLKSFAMGYSFYRGKYTDALKDIVPEFIDKKTIIHIPNVNSGESTKDKYGEVDDILDQLGDYLDKDEHGIISIETSSGKILRVADLVTEEGREKVTGYITQMSQLDDLDMIIALGMAKEGFDWPFAEYALTIGYRSSLTEVVQIIGRVTRDSVNKKHAQFTNLIAQPDAQDDEVQYAVNNVMKAITASLLMENVLAPDFKFRRKDNDGQKSEGADIFIKGLANPSSERSKQIIEQDMTELKASILQDSLIQGAIATGTDAKVINKQLIPRVIATMYPDLTNQETKEVCHHVLTGMNLTYAERDKENNKILKMADKFINIDELSIDLIYSVNPFQRAYEIVSKSIDSETLRIISKLFDGKKYDFSEQELILLYPQIKDFRLNKGRNPDRNSSDEEEKRLAYAVARLAQLRRKRNG